ncbi:alpha-glucosidase [Streptococcaceae bacterium ESL0687]|nr:alpha-glucosidase [Streptococcaceae bacterium ESL0687]
MKKTRNDFKSLVGYQIYPKSFKDSNADGMGDISGIIEKLPYLSDLGIDFIWLNPLYKSPQVDGGYDISDFYQVDQMFGTLDDLKKLIKEAHALGIKLIMDLVINHTSDQHPWFLESKKSKDNPYRDYYHWEDAEPDKMPNDWKSFFGGSTWTYDDQTGQAYFHVFAKEQPDLNWKNPKLREEIYQMIRWWLDLGIDGFRLDAISHIQKEDWSFEIKGPHGNDPWEPFMNVRGIEEYMLKIKEIFDDYGALTVGEASGVTSKAARSWTGSKGYIDMIFELEHNAKEENNPNNKIDLKVYKETIIRWQEDLSEEGWNALYIENHDNPRSIDVFGDGSLQSAKALAVHYMLLRGTPFIYQGQEIGMTNFPFENINQFEAPESRNYYEALLKEGLDPKDSLTRVAVVSRDNSRTPMQWTNQLEAGFTSAKPWFPLNPNYREINVAENEHDPKSLLSLYKKLISLKHERKEISEGSIEFYDRENPQIFSYKRSHEGRELLVLVNLSATPTSTSFNDFEGFKELTLDQTGLKPLSSKMDLDPFEYRLYER